ncbi:MAG: hypothetical protein RLZZ563_900 [Pseudomonadota bacterium]|jgi:hypothetical protein
MEYGMKILAKIGLFAHKADHVDPQFDMRLQRIGAREQLRAAQSGPISGALAGGLKSPHEPRAI